MDKADVLTAGTLREIVTYNERGAKLCNWKAPGQ